MKIWQSYSGEHSSSLRIIGKFKSVEDAEKAASLFNRFLDIRINSGIAPEDMWKENELNEFMKETKSYDVMSQNDYERLEYYYPLESTGDRIIVKLDEYEVQPVIKAMLFYGASIEMYDLDVHPEKKYDV